MGVIHFHQLCKDMPHWTNLILASIYEFPTYLCERLVVKSEEHCIFLKSIFEKS